MPRLFEQLGHGIFHRVMENLCHRTVRMAVAGSLHDALQIPSEQKGFFASPVLMRVITEVVNHPCAWCPLGLNKVDPIVRGRHGLVLGDHELPAVARRRRCYRRDEEGLIPRSVDRVDLFKVGMLGAAL